MIKTYLSLFKNSIFVMPLVMIFSYFLKGKKEKYEDYFAIDLKNKFDAKSDFGNISIDINLNDKDNLTSILEKLASQETKEILVNLIYERQKLDKEFKKDLIQIFTRLKGISNNINLKVKVEPDSDLTLLLDFYKFTQTILYENFSNYKLYNLNINSSNLKFLLKVFFNKYFIKYDKTIMPFNVNLDNKPEKKEYVVMDFSRKIDIHYSISMLSAISSNDNICLNLNFANTKKENLDNFLRYCLLSFSSQKVDRLYINHEILKDSNYKLAFDTMMNYLENSTLVKFSNSKDLYVITVKNKKQKFDIIWSSSNRGIELTDMNKVFDKFGKEIKENIKISESPIYALHK